MPQEKLSLTNEKSEEMCCKGYVPVGPFHSREVRLSLEPTLKLHSKLGRFPVNKTRKTVVYLGPIHTYPAHVSTYPDSL